MGIFFKCKSCGSDLYSTDLKGELQFPKYYICHVCGSTNDYLGNEIQEERYDLSCSFCNGPFHVRRSLPLSVRCPHCKSDLYVNSDGSISIVTQGNRPTTTKKGTAGGLLGGLAVGAIVGGPVGALIGAILGGVVGSTQDNREGEYLE